MTQGELEKIPEDVISQISELEERIMEDIVRKIEANGFSGAATDWQINRLQQLGMTEKEIRKQIAEALNATDEEIDRIFSEVVYKEYYGHDRAYEMSDVIQIPIEENRELMELISAVKEQTKGEFRNMTGSMGFAIQEPGSTRLSYKTLKTFYTSALDAAMWDIASGAFDYNTALKRTIETMTKSGVRQIDYESGVGRRVDVAARTAIMTGFRQIQGKINEQIAKDLNTDFYEVSYHVGARPTHQPWQGRVWSKKELEDVCGLGTVIGLHGANCYHDYNAFIPGISTRTYTDAQLEEMLEEENTPKEYNGKEYTTYEALQQQRKQERAMRKNRQDIKLMEAGGADAEDIILKKAKYQGQLQTYKDFSEKMKLPMQMDRVYQDGLRGKFTPTKTEQKIMDAAMGKERGISRKKMPKEDMYRTNSEVINSNAYKRKFNGITGTKVADEAVYKYAKAALKHRDGTTGEDLYILSESKGTVLGKNVSSTEPFGVKLNKSIRDAVKGNQGDLIGLHNHPDGTPPTGSDFDAAFKRRYSLGIVACADGSVYTYKTGERYVMPELIDARIQKYMLMVDENGKAIYNNAKDAHLAALDSLRKEYGIQYEAR